MAAVRIYVYWSKYREVILRPNQPFNNFIIFSLSVRKTYQCACPHVMRLDPMDNRTCVANEQVLLFIMGDEIRGIDLMQPNHHTIPTIRQSPQVRMALKSKRVLN